MVEKFKGKLAFGCMRLPMLSEDKVDIEQFKKMVDIFLENGYNYFDTAHGYLNGLSEKALKEGLTSRYPRDQYILVNKLTHTFFNSEEEIEPLVRSQLEICGVDYFDIYLMHCQTAGIYEHFKKCNGYQKAFELKEKGLFNHIGFSFHDSPEVLDMILTENPGVEFVQLQFNYLDFEDKGVQAKKCYEVCVKHGKHVLVMEPVRGGKLANLPNNAKKILDDLNNGSNASYALRFCAGFENIKMILSGMSTIEQMEDNVKVMKDVKPLNETELEAVQKVVEIFRNTEVIDCTKCEYCMPVCPINMPIPEIFKRSNENNKIAYMKLGTLASECLRCGACEHECPQHLPIRELLEKVADKFE